MKSMRVKREEYANSGRGRFTLPSALFALNAFLFLIETGIAICPFSVMVAVLISVIILLVR